MWIKVRTIVEDNRCFAQIDGDLLGDIRIKTNNGRQVQVGDELCVSLSVDPRWNPPTVSRFWATATEI